MSLFLICSEEASAFDNFSFLLESHEVVEIQAERFQGTLVILKAKQEGSGVAQESVSLMPVSSHLCTNRALKYVCT